MRAKVINDLPPGKSHAIPDDITISSLSVLKEQPETERISQLRKGVKDMLRHRTDEATVPLQQEQPTRPPSKQPGYAQPARVGKVTMATFTDPDTRREFNAIAKAAQMTSTEFLEQVIKNTVASAKKDPKIAKVLKAQAELIRDLGNTEGQLAARISLHKPTHG